MKRTKTFLAAALAVVSATAMTVFTVNATMSLQTSSWNPNPRNAENNTPMVNVAQAGGVVITGDSWADGENRGLECLNDGTTVPCQANSSLSALCRTAARRFYMIKQPMNSSRNIVFIPATVSILRPRR